MPPTRINSIAEPKNKRAKTERGKLTRQKSATANNKKDLNNTTTSSTENDESLSAPPPPTTTNKKTQNKKIELAESTNKNTTASKNDKKAAAAAAEAASAKEETTTSEEEPEKEPVKAPARGKNTKKTESKIVEQPAAATAMPDDTVMTDLSANQANNLTVDATMLPADITVSANRNSKSGFVLAVGENLSNQLGLGSEVDNRKKPQVVKDLPDNVIQVASGGMHSASLTADGIVYTFGCNDEFALGRDNEEDIDKVNLPEKIIEITAGDSHTAALSETGVVYAWGTFRDGSGVLGLEQKKIAKTPMTFKLKEKIAKITSGADHIVFLTQTGEVYTAGNSEHGQLGRVSRYNSCRGGRRGCDMILEPALVRISKRRELQGHKQIEDIWATPYCTFLKVKDSDLIVGFGLNNCYQLGMEDAENRYQPDILKTLKFESKLKKVIGGMHHTLFLDTNGNVYSMGSHRYGGLGLNKIDADVKQPTRIPDLKDIIDIAANTNVSYAISKTGKCYSWGTNYSKQLGQDTEDDYFVPTLVNSKQVDVRDVYTVSVGGQHSLFVVSDEKDEDSDSD